MSILSSSLPPSMSAFSPPFSSLSFSLPHAPSQTLAHTHSPVPFNSSPPLRSASPPSSTNPDDAAALYKTEFCKSFSDTGVCRYGARCRFAHGLADLRPVSRHKKYKTEQCKNFLRDGRCQYGSRCRFVHNQATADQDELPGLGPIDQFIAKGGKIVNKEDEVPMVRSRSSSLSFNPPPNSGAPFTAANSSRSYSASNSARSSIIGSSIHSAMSFYSRPTTATLTGRRGSGDSIDGLRESSASGLPAEPLEGDANHEMLDFNVQSIIHSLDNDSDQEEQNAVDIPSQSAAVRVLGFNPSPPKSLPLLPSANSPILSGVAPHSANLWDSTGLPLNARGSHTYSPILSTLLTPLPSFSQANTSGSPAALGDFEDFNLPPAVDEPVAAMSELNINLHRISVSSVNSVFYGSNGV